MQANRDLESGLSIGSSVLALRHKFDLTSTVLTDVLSETPTIGDAS